MSEPYWRRQAPNHDCIGMSFTAKNSARPQTHDAKHKSRTAT